MEEEYAALLANQTWDLVPCPPGGNVVTGKWIWTHKRRADGTLDRYKAHWVLRGFTHRPGVDYDETFSPVVKPAISLSLALSRSWPVHQLDVKNAFLHGTLTETVYCSQPVGFVDPARPEMVCRLNKSLYGLNQAPQAWYSRFATFLVTLGFTKAKLDTSLFVYRHGDKTTYLLLYVDDIVLIASSQHLLQRITTSLQQEFAMKDLGVLHNFLGVTMSPWQCTLDILERAGMTDCNPCSNPVDTQAKLSEDVGTPVADPTAYRSLAGALQYLTFTRPDITYAVCLHMHDPREPYLTALKRLLRYLRGTVDYGLLLHRSSSAELVYYTDADWAGCPDTRRSMSGTLSSWAATLSLGHPSGSQLSRSSAEAEYRAVAKGVAEASWLRQLLAELHSPLAKSTLVYWDNVSAVYLSTNPVQHQRTKHVEIDLHFVHDQVTIGDVRVLHVPTTSYLKLRCARSSDCGGVLEVRQQNKTEHLRPAGLLQPLQVLILLWTSSRGCRASMAKQLLTVVDRFSKFAHFIPLAHSYTATTVAQAFFAEIVRLHGIPSSIVSDSDPVFTSTFWRELFRLSVVQMNMTSAYHPQSDGQSEATNKIISMYLRCLTGHRPWQWVQWLAWAEYCYNSSFQASLGTSPLRVVYGRDPPSLRPYNGTSATLPTMDQQLWDRDEFLVEIRDRLEQA
ncbi:LOW QUALITY PROTEIN: hypothetical protein U9M48_043124 [Paspalum notatum var. saurae]|uniref:Integrase catalytic domain-containing protein n=1 Tax=Paspalum notatum var. saurae TaxID=547442 RepID=A0AAQ3US66_PASNO